MIRKLFLAATIIVDATILHAQVPGGGTPGPDSKMLAGTPSGSALSNLYSPNLFDGSTNVNIPVYRYGNEYGDYGISLSYDTRGVKVDEVVNEAGLHWTLNACGSITRSVKDLPDELNFITPEKFEVTDNPSEDFINHNRYLKGKLVTYTETATQLAAPNVYRDKECDDYTVSAGSMSFTFSMGKNNRIFTHPHRNIKITVLLNGVVISATPGTVIPAATIGTPPTADMGKLEFRITDEMGVQYYFKAGNAVSFDVFKNEYWPDRKTATTDLTVKWVVSKIVFPNGDEINYTYTDPAYTIGGYDQYRQDYASEYFFTPYNPKYLGFNNVRQAIDIWRLASIQYPNGVKAEFNFNATDMSENGQPMLDEIKISEKTNCKRYRLSRSKPDARRWFLDSIKTVSCDGTVTEPYYSFEYDNTIPLPRRLNPGQDFYGYYSGDSAAVPLLASEAEQKNMMIPYHQVALSGVWYGADRAFNLNCAKAGILRKVNNGAGGSIRFTYKANTGTGQLSLPSYPYFFGQSQLDGLCIDSIVETDDYYQGKTGITTFTFAGGQIFMPGGIFHYAQYVDSATSNWDTLMMQGTFLSAHQLINGSNHGYSQATVRRYAGTGSLISRSDVRFTNMKDETSGMKPRYRVAGGGMNYYDYPYTDKQYLKDWEIGLPLEITDYDNNDRIVSKTINQYTFSPVDSSASSYITNTKTILVNSGVSKGSGPYYGIYYPNKKSFTDTYVPYTGNAQLSRVITQSYVSDIRLVSDTAWYTYDSCNNLAATITRNSRGRKVRTDEIYNYDIPATAGSVISNMNNAGLERKVASQTWLVGSTGFASDSLLGAYVNGYRYSGARLFSRNIYNLVNGSPVSFGGYTGYSGGAMPVLYGNLANAFTGSDMPYYRKAAEVLRFDARGNPEETQVKGQEIYKCMLWDTISGHKLAEAGNCRFADIAYTSFENYEPGPSGTPNVSRGNVSFRTDQVIPAATAGTVTGSSAYRIAGTDIADSVSGWLTLSAGREYVLTFWARNAVPRVYISDIAITAPVPELTVGSWKFYRIVATPGIAGRFLIRRPSAGTTIYLDEIRLVPTGAAMQSWTYQPLYGVSSATDANGRITYFEYDKLGRQTVVRDQETNILGKTQYTVQGAE